MAIVINPYIPLASVEDRETYLSLVNDVAHETQRSEPECLAYCWTRPIHTPEDCTDGSTFVQGIEVYRDHEALTVTHRSSTPYLRMREVIASTALITFPKGGVPIYKPTGAGFLSKDGAAESVSSQNVFVIIQNTAQGPEALSRFIEEETRLCNEMKDLDGVQTFWCFIPDHTEVEVPVTLFVRLSDESFFVSIDQSLRSFESTTLVRNDITKTRWWKGKGFGFFRSSQ